MHSAMWSNMGGLGDGERAPPRAAQEGAQGRRRVEARGGTRASDVSRLSSEVLSVCSSRSTGWTEKRYAASQRKEKTTDLTTPDRPLLCTNTAVHAMSTSSSCSAACC